MSAAELAEWIAYSKEEREGMEKKEEKKAEAESLNLLQSFRSHNAAVAQRNGGRR